MDLGPAGRTRPGFTELRRLRGLAGVSEQEERVTLVGGWPGRRRHRRGGVCVPAGCLCTCVVTHQRWERPSGGRGTRLPAPCPPAPPGGGQLSCPPRSGRLCPSHSPGANPELAARGLLVGDPAPSPVLSSGGGRGSGSAQVTWTPCPRVLVSVPPSPSCFMAWGWPLGLCPGAVAPRPPEKARYPPGSDRSLTL